MIDYLRPMAIFCKVVDCGSISGAAKELNLSKSVVSQHLKSLEQALGVQLLNRTTRRQVLTPAGRDFYQQCTRVQNISQQAWDDARQAQQQAVGSVSISAPHALIEQVVAPAIGALVAEHGRISPRLNADDQRVNLIGDDIDLAIRVGRMPSSDYMQRKLGQFREVLCASPSYLATKKLSLETLASSPEQQKNCG